MLKELTSFGIVYGQIAGIKSFVTLLSKQEVTGFTSLELFQTLMEMRWELLSPVINYIE